MERFTRSGDTGLLVTLLGQTEEGEVVLYEQINEHIGRDIRENRGSLRSARRILEKDGIVFECVPNEGYRRLPPGDVVLTIDGMRARQHRIANKACRRLAGVVTDRLSETERKRYYTHLSIQGALSSATRATAVKRVESEVNGSTQQLAVARTLEALK